MQGDLVTLLWVYQLVDLFDNIADSEMDRPVRAGLEAHQRLPWSLHRRHAHQRAGQNEAVLIGPGGGTGFGRHIVCGQ
jgi:hypothetical protein